MRSVARLTLFAALGLGLGACTSGTGPSDGANLTGTWTGSFGGTTIRMVLQQSGDDVTGDFSASASTYVLRGTIDRTTGVFSWSTQADPATCITWGSSSMQLADQARALSGRARRSQTAPPCGTGRTAVTTGTMTLSRAF